MLAQKLIGSVVTQAGVEYTVLNGGVSSVTSTLLIVPYPSGIQAGDLLVVIGYVNGNVSASTPSGWNNTYNGPYAPIFFKTATGSETGSLSITKNTTTTNARAEMFALRSNAGAPSIKGSQQGFQGSGTSYTPIGLQNNGSDLNLAGFGFGTARATAVSGFPKPFVNETLASGWSSWYSPNCTSNVTITTNGSVNIRSLVINVN